MKNSSGIAPFAPIGWSKGGGELINMKGKIMKEKKQD
jgi:hypothetical protein